MANITEEFLGSVGLLQILNGVALDTTLRAVTDQSNNASALYLSTTQVRIGTVTSDTPLVLLGAQNVTATFNTVNISGTSKTFTLPNASLTFAGIDIAQTFSDANTFSTIQTFNVPNGTSGTANISIPTIPFSGGGRNANHPTLVLGSVTGSIWGLSGNGTYLGINAPTTFTGNLIDLKLNGTTVLNITQTGALTSTASGAASTPALSLTGTPFVGTGTTSVPLFYLNGGTAPITWDNTTTGGTYIGINSIANFAGNFIDFRKNGGSSVFKVDNAGTATISNINLGPSAAAGGILNLGNGGNGSAIQAAGLQVYNFSSRHRFDGDGTGSAFVGRVYIGGNSATNVSAQFQIDSTVRSFLPPRLSTGQQQFIGAAISAAGSGYVNGTYTNVPLTGGTGTSAQATIVVSSGVVSSVTITTFGSGYKVADVLSASNSNLGGAGSGFTYTLPSQPVGLVHYNTTLNKLVVYTGAITNNGWETITSV